MRGSGSSATGATRKASRTRRELGWGVFRCETETKSATPNQEDAEGDGQNAHDGAGGHAFIQRKSAEEQDRDRGRSASDRVDDRHLTAVVRPSKQDEIDELEYGGRDDVRKR